ncbi:unnamed protein product, partial [Ilex paraguariensis]
AQLISESEAIWSQSQRPGGPEIRRDQLLVESGISWSRSLGHFAPETGTSGFLTNGPVGNRLRRDQLIFESGTSWSHSQGSGSLSARDQLVSRSGTSWSQNQGPNGPG